MQFSKSSIRLIVHFQIIFDYILKLYVIKILIHYERAKSISFKFKSISLFFSFSYSFFKETIGISRKNSDTPYMHIYA